jgi:uncharacterized small protein (DUF1192 family)
MQSKYEQLKAENALPKGDIVFFDGRGDALDGYSVSKVWEIVSALQAENERLKAELDKAQDEIHCAESSLEAFSCEFEAEVFNQGFDCLGDFVQALWTASNGQRDALQAKCAGLEHVKNAFELQMLTLQSQLNAMGKGEPVVPAAWTNLLAYVLQDDMHNRLTPRVIDIAYTAFTLAKQPNIEDGGASDWFNDTKPHITKLIAKLHKDLAEELDAAPKALAPLTNEQMEKGQWDDGTSCTADFYEGARFAEKHHGIGGTP